MDLCDSKYLLHMPGSASSYSQRLKYLFACGAVVVISETEFYEFWYPMLRPYEHFIPAGNLELTGGADLPMIVECLRSHDEDAKILAANAHEFVQTHLVADVHERYLAPAASAAFYSGASWPPPLLSLAVSGGCWWFALALR